MFRQRSPALAFVLLVFVAVSAAPQRGAAAPRAEAAEQDIAGALVDAALKLARQGRFKDAIDVLQKAYDLDPAPVLLYNIAYVLEKKGDDVAALEYYERYVGSGVSGDDRDVALGRLQRLRAEVPAWLTLRCSVPEAIAELDGEVIARGPLNTRVRLKPGTHTLRVFRHGLPPYDETFEVAAGEAITRGPGLLHEKPEVAYVASASGLSGVRVKRTTREDRRKMWGWISAGAAVLVGGAVATWILLDERPASSTDAVWVMPR